ncbi:hypothetical protein HJG60_010102 [Phyllostomus discolor]|uniref:Uncharacterized protein n=1 Tax=Phyllostomus discolor TaxID=89673 RepID=A0A834B200_9CHIR|nr:hypothetical protein HJG60_010102 [Phyllostomus discolor]
MFLPPGFIHFHTVCTMKYTQVHPQNSDIILETGQKVNMGTKSQGNQRLILFPKKRPVLNPIPELNLAVNVGIKSIKHVSVTLTCKFFFTNTNTKSKLLISFFKNFYFNHCLSTFFCPLLPFQPIHPSYLYP